MSSDITVRCDEGFINIRVGAIIMKDGKFLMAGNDAVDYLYTVGGRIQFGESAEEAVVREVLEETGVKMEIDRLGFIHENFFYGDSSHNMGRLVYEISFIFYMKVPEDFHPVSQSRPGDSHQEPLYWISAGSDTEHDTSDTSDTSDTLDTLDSLEKITIYPGFLRTELMNPVDGVRHLVTRDGKTTLAK